MIEMVNSYKDSIKYQGTQNARKNIKHHLPLHPVMFANYNHVLHVHILDLLARYNQAHPVDIVKDQTL